MSLAQRFAGQPLKQPCYNFRDVPWCSKDLSGSTLSEVTDREHFVDSIAEMVLLCNEATRRKHIQKQSSSSSGSSSDGSATKKPICSKPLSIEYIFDRIDTDDPIWGFMARTDTPVSHKGRASTAKAAPQWRRGMLQGFITVTTFTCWKSSFRFDSLHDIAFAYDHDELKEKKMAGVRKYDEDGMLAEEMEKSVRGGDPWNEGIVFPRIAEVSLFGGLGCGKQLLNLVIERLERAKPSATQNYDFIILQATENSVPFYESMGFVRVGCVQDKSPSPHGYNSSPVDSYVTSKNGETPQKIANQLGVDVWDIIFLNTPCFPQIKTKSWLKKGTTVFVPSSKIEIHATSDATRNQQLGGSLEDATLAPRWYTARENDTPRGIAKKFKVNFGELLQANKRRYPDLVGHSRLRDGTRIQISRFDIDDCHYTPYFHWTFPDDQIEADEPSYMMALKLNRKTGSSAATRPVSSSFSVNIQEYSPESTGATELLLQPKPLPTSNATTKKAPNISEPKKPKRPSSPYVIFCSEARKTMSEELKGKSGAESVKLYAEKWNSMTEKEKMRYKDQFAKSQAAYTEALKKYEQDLAKFREENPEAAKSQSGVDTSLLEKVVKLKKSAGALGHAAKFEYFYVLTFIPDLQWVHLIPMIKAGVFGPEYPEAYGRPIWMTVGEDEGKELDTSASFCIPVASRTMKNSADADDEQWDIPETGDGTPLAPIFAKNTQNQMNPSKPNFVPKEPPKPKRPATSFAIYCSEARTLFRDELKDKTLVERTRIVAEKWKNMSEEEKLPFKEKNAKLQAAYSEALKQYKTDLVQFRRENPEALLSDQPENDAQQAPPNTPQPMISYSPTGTLTPSNTSQTLKATPVTTPKSKKLPSSPCNHPTAKSVAHIPSQPARGFPDGWVTRRLPGSDPSKPETTYWYSPQMGFQFGSKQEALRFLEKLDIAGGDEGIAIQIIYRLTSKTTPKRSPDEPLKPKKPSRPFVLFFSEARLCEEFKGKSAPECTKLASEKWNALTEEAKQPYKDRFKEMSEEFTIAIKQYEKDLVAFLQNSQVAHRADSKHTSSTPLIGTVLEKKFKSPPPRTVSNIPLAPLFVKNDNNEKEDTTRPSPKKTTQSKKRKLESQKSAVSVESVPVVSDDASSADGVEPLNKKMKA